MTRQDLHFTSSGLRCAAWFYPGRSDSEQTPLVIMAHGLGATRELRLGAYAERFQSAGYAALVFDYRHYGASEGEPRELLSISKQLDDWRAAIAFGKTLPGIDPARVVIWGSSFGGGHVLTLAAEDHDLAAAISQVPFSDGLASTFAIPFLTSLRITLAAIFDVLRAALGMSPHYIGLLGRPGDVALMSAADCYDGYRQLVAPDVERAGRWRNRVSARTGLAIPFYAPARAAAKIKIPILIAVAEQDSIAPSSPTIRAAGRAAEAELKRYPGGHFDYYTGSGFETIMTDELEFLQRVVPLKVREGHPSSARLEPIASAVRVDETMLRVQLVDGRELSVPLAWYPKLANATPEQRANFRLVGRGVGVHWPDLDEDLSVLGMLVGVATRAA